MAWKRKFPHLVISIILSMLFYFAYWFSFNYAPDFHPPTSWWLDALQRSFLWGIMLGAASSFGLYAMQERKILRVLFAVLCVLAMPIMIATRFGFSLTGRAADIHLYFNPWIDSLIVIAVICWVGFVVVALLGLLAGV